MFLNRNIVSKLLVLTFIAFQLTSCKSADIEDEKVIEKHINEVLKHSVLKRVQDHGVVLKEYDDYSWIIDFIENNPFEKNGVLEYTKDSITRVFFNQTNKDNYIKQLESEKFKLNKLNFNNEKIKVFSVTLNDRLQTSNHVKFNISKPLFSKDKQKAIVFSSSSHEPNIYLFIKIFNSNTKLGEWELYKKYNSLFSSLNY